MLRERKYAVCVQHDRARGLAQQRAHDLGHLVLAAKSAADEQRVRMLRQL